MAVDEHIVEEHIEDISGGIVDHRRLGVAHTAQRRCNGGGQGQSGQADHLDAQVGHTGFQHMGFTGAHELDQPRRCDESDHREHHSQHKGHQQALAQDLIGLFLVAGTLVPGYHRCGTHIHGHKHGHQQELGLGGQAHRSQGPGAQLSHHHQVYHRGELRKGQLHQRWPGNVYNIAVQHLGFDPIRKRLAHLQVRHAVFFICSHRHQIQCQRTHLCLASPGLSGCDGAVLCLLRHLSKPLFVKNQR